VLGLLLAPSLSGVFLALLATVAFVARTPLKVVLVDRRRRRALARTTLAGRIAAAELAAGGLFLIAATILATGPFWVPLAVAAPLIGLELWFDMRSRSRRLLPELAGTIGIGSVAAAIVLAGGGSNVLAAGAWLLLAARAIASIPFVRRQIQRAKHQPASRWGYLVAQLAAVALALAGAFAGWLSWPAAAALAALALIQLVLAQLPPQRAVLVGIQQMGLGLGVVIVAGLTMG
jgi:hypothetical protein